MMCLHDPDAQDTICHAPDDVRLPHDVPVWLSSPIRSRDRLVRGSDANNWAPVSQRASSSNTVGRITATAHYAHASHCTGVRCVVPDHAHAELSGETLLHARTSYGNTGSAINEPLQTVEHIADSLHCVPPSDRPNSSVWWRTCACRVILDSGDADAWHGRSGQRSHVRHGERRDGNLGESPRHACCAVWLLWGLTVTSDDEVQLLPSRLCK
jgi:hypothetical protein